MRRFIDDIKNPPCLKGNYYSGHVSRNDYEEPGTTYYVAYEQQGAADTFSVGMPVYDKEKNLMGFLGVGLWQNLNYAKGDMTPDGVSIPVERWEIRNPTQFCQQGKDVFTFWQVAEVEIK